MSEPASEPPNPARPADGLASDVLIRPAEAGDLPFLTDMLIEAANAPGYEHTRDELLSDPRVTGYLDGWPRPTDLGVLAVDADDKPAGATWFRFFTAAEPAFGFVSPDIPELAIGVAAPWRGKGVGRLLLRALADQARAAGIACLSLSVDRANPARHLYRGEGYQLVRSTETSDIMTLDLPRAPNVVTRSCPPSGDG